MEYRQLGRSGLRISRLTLGTMTFGGSGNFADVGSTDVEGARRQIDMAIDAGVNLIDTADVYSGGAAGVTRCSWPARPAFPWDPDPTTPDYPVST
jgi:aryl-alcohol dehydrogenase-like predicted oxidoreductase